MSNQFFLLAVIVLITTLTMLTLNIADHAFATMSTGTAGQSQLGGGSSGAIMGSGTAGQSQVGGGSSGAIMGSGTAGQSGANVGGVDRHLFCNTGVITPICK